MATATPTYTATDKTLIPEFNLPQSGLYFIKTRVATGPVIIEANDGNGWDALTDGSFAATADNVLNLSCEILYRATIPSGDSLTFSIVSVTP